MQLLVVMLMADGFAPDVEKMQRTAAAFILYALVGLVMILLVDKLWPEKKK